MCKSPFIAIELAVHALLQRMLSKLRCHFETVVAYCTLTYKAALSKTTTRCNEHISSVQHDSLELMSWRMHAAARVM
jgi:hypothetical protein